LFSKKQNKKIAINKLIKSKYPDLTDKEVLAYILCKEVLVNGELVSSHHTLVPWDATLEFVQKKRFVSRGGIKLAHVLDLWQLNVQAKIFIDVGASTGGFTHCLLQYGVKSVYSVDVGYCQLDYSLRYNPQVIVMERTNIMQLNSASFPVSPQSAVCDLSFRSIQGAARHILSLVEEKWFIALIKPQFEWQRPATHFKGVIKEEQDLQEVLNSLIEQLWQEGSYVTRVAASPIKGRKGNQEFFFLIKTEQEVTKDEILTSVQQLFVKG
jgi:23S rRNA (cytidine1920-2'-O)/16S rRNA (cytidine1409-2'-O)-methyltransferase